MKSWRNIRPVRSFHLWNSKNYGNWTFFKSLFQFDSISILQTLWIHMNHIILLTLKRIFQWRQAILNGNKRLENVWCSLTQTYFRIKHHVNMSKSLRLIDANVNHANNNTEKNLYEEWSRSVTIKYVNMEYKCWCDCLFFIRLDQKWAFQLISNVNTTFDNNFS